MGLYGFMMAMALSAVYGVIEPDLNGKKRSIIVAMSLLTAATMAFALFHLPGAGILSLACGANILLYIYLRWFTQNEFKAEMGVLTLLCTESVIRFLIVSGHFYG